MLTVETKDLLGVGVIGLGVGRQHALAYVNSGQCRLRWACDFDEEQARRITEELGQGQITRNYEDILADPLTQLVSIASFDDMHCDQVLAALALKKHVFVEKPLCRSLDELRTIREKWQAAGRVHLASNLVLRAAPLYRWLKAEIAGGTLGTIYAFDGDYLYGRLGKITDGWRKDVLNYSVMQGGGVHMVDLMLWLTGQRPVEVTTVGNRLCTKGTAFRYDDAMFATYTFASGLIGRITANFGCVHRHQHVLRVFGTKATFIYDDQGPRIHTSRDAEAGASALNLSGLPHAKGALIPDFINAILEKKDPKPQAQREFDLISACAASDRSLQENKPMRIEYL